MKILSGGYRGDGRNSCEGSVGGQRGSRWCRWRAAARTSVKDVRGEVQYSVSPPRTLEACESISRAWRP